MLTVRRADERGHFQNNWLDSYHSFSFGEYYDPKHMGVSVLRVINDDKIIAGAGFPTHPHNNMEIVTYVLHGEVAHKDSMGTGSTIKPGDVQRMSAGTGVTHSEFNPSNVNGTHLLQIWLLPSERNIQPGYDQKYFAPEQKQNQLKLLVSPDGRDGSIQATTEALMYGSLLESGHELEHALEGDRVAYVHVASGEVSVNGEQLNTGDGLTVEGETALSISSDSKAEILLFDLPKSY